ncbi:GAF domain-containing sensor histidine kinase [Nocardioides marmoribigeumensis]|uniref:Sensor-like histidine kinase SenX3 n=1 Tax=Nocardioides marmoribigeumensis TaxID=433649 RepID=A0ABU2BXA5_9ACTN|nr:GAF domain-containing sensor histidine kinase [Nocardioides marmoribigeumensis]MDR7363028.1 signal transduction histidine kinase [Nocardioides marmoribigeumensis]
MSEHAIALNPSYAVRAPDALAPASHPDPASPHPGLRALWALSRADDDQLQTLVDLVQDLCDVPLAALAIFEGSDYHLTTTAGIAPLVCDAQDTLCVQVMDTRETVHVADVRRDGRFDASPYVDGRFMSLGFYASAPVVDPDGTMVGRLCVFDLEPRELTESQLRALTAVAADVSNIIELHLRREADRPLPHHAGPDELLDLSSQIARELRTPLMAVLTSLELLAETEPDADPSRRRVLNSAHRSTRRLNDVVDRLLTLSKVGRTVEPAPVDLGDVFDLVARDTSLVVQTAGGSLAAGELPMVAADAGQVHRVLLELVTNAVRAARPGVPPRVAVWATPTDGGDAWRVSVTDNGVGIPAEARATLFDTATRLASVSRGEGVGLARVARIVEAHGGRLGAEASPGGGTTVWFELPALLPCTEA